MDSEAYVKRQAGTTLSLSLALHGIRPDIMNVIIKYKCGMTVCDDMLMYEFLVK